jgi:hypothetical protein
VVDTKQLCKEDKMRFPILVTRGITVLFVLLAVSIIAACASPSTALQTQTLTFYQDAPTMNPLDVGAPGNSPGDVYYFYAPLHSAAGGPVTGEVFGTKTLIKTATNENPDTEQRATILVFTFGNREDQIIVAGVPDYPSDAAEFDAGQPVLRAILGGTGRYIGARGQLTSTRNADGSYVQVFTLLGN